MQRYLGIKTTGMYFWYMYGVGGIQVLHYWTSHPIYVHREIWSFTCHFAVIVTQESETKRSFRRVRSTGLKSKLFSVYFLWPEIESVPYVIFFEHFCSCYHHARLRHSTIACPPFQSGLWTMKGRGEGNKKECSAVRVDLLWERKGSLKSFNLPLC